MFCPDDIISIKSTRERSPVRPKPPYHRGTPVLLFDIGDKLFAIPRSLIILFHFRRLRTYLNGIRTETDYTYSDTYFTLTGCFWTANGIFISSQTAYVNTKYTSIGMVSLCHKSNSLSAVLDGSYKATRTALSRTASDMTILICFLSPSVLALILSDRMNSS